MTDAERQLWSLLSHRGMDGFHFRRQVPIGAYIADFACHHAKLIIEVDGGQHDLDAPAEIARTRFLESEGYRVIRFWNNEVLGNLEGVHMVINDALLGPPSPPPNPPPSRGRAL